MQHATSDMHDHQDPHATTSSLDNIRRLGTCAIKPGAKALLPSTSTLCRVVTHGVATAQDDANDDYINFSLDEDAIYTNMRLGLHRLLVQQRHQLHRHVATRLHQQSTSSRSTRLQPDRVSTSLCVPPTLQGLHQQVRCTVVIKQRHHAVTLTSTPTSTSPHSSSTSAKHRRGKATPTTCLLPRKQNTPHCRAPTR